MMGLKPGRRSERLATIDFLCLLFVSIRLFSFALRCKRLEKESCTLTGFPEVFVGCLEFPVVLEC